MSFVFFDSTSSYPAALEGRTPTWRARAGLGYLVCCFFVSLMFFFPIQLTNNRKKQNKKKLFFLIVSFTFLLVCYLSIYIDFDFGSVRLIFTAAETQT